MNECPHCNTHNPPQAVTCRVCNLTVPRSNPPILSAGRTLPKLAVFDLDNTILDLSRRERIARRQGIKEKSPKWYDFLNQNQYVLLDTAIPGTASFIKSLSDDGYTIAYLSGRPNSVLSATKQNLQELGFPIDATDRDLVFLHNGGKPTIDNLTNHKKSVLTHLKSMFDIHFLFDDTPEFREAGKSLFIPGVYSSISSYTGKEVRPSASKKTKSKKPRNNPSELRCLEHGMVNYDETEAIEQGAVHPFTGEVVTSPVLIHKGCGLAVKGIGNVRVNPGHGEDRCPSTTAVDPYTGIYYACSEPEYHGGQHDFSIEMVAPDVVDPDGDNPFANPELMNPPKPRKKRNKAGNMIKEPVKKYMKRFMADPKMNKQFPKNKQRFAVGLNYAREFYGEATVDKNFKPYPPIDNPLGLFKKKEKPSEAVLKGVGLYRELWESVENEYSEFNEDYQRRELVADSWSDGEDTAGINWQFMEELFPLAKYLEGTLHIYYYDIHDIKLKDFDTLKEAVDSYEIKLKKLYANDPTGYSHLKDFHYSNYDDVKEGFASGVPSGDVNFAVDFTKRNLKKFQKMLDSREAKNNPRSNPHFPVSKAKEFYKQFHKKAPSSVKKQKIDFGDTWVGLGKAWSLGYRSGKETGDDSQKYIHNFGVDEETGKKFKEPDVYYVKNNDGTQMMVIMGGDWYIDVDADGEVSWIYV